MTAVVRAIALERFGVEPLTVLPPEMDVIVELSQLSGA